MRATIYIKAPCKSDLMSMLARELNFVWSNEFSFNWTSELAIDDNEDFNEHARTEKDFEHFPFLLDVEDSQISKEEFISLLNRINSILRVAKFLFVTSADFEDELNAFGRSGAIR